LKKKNKMEWSVSDDKTQMWLGSFSKTKCCAWRALPTSKKWQVEIYGKRVIKIKCDTIEEAQLLIESIINGD